MGQALRCSSPNLCLMLQVPLALPLALLALQVPVLLPLAQPALPPLMKQRLAYRDLVWIFPHWWRLTRVSNKWS